MTASPIYCPLHVGGKPGCEECYRLVASYFPYQLKTTTALYAGSFEPWHVGHSDILEKTLKVFDRAIVLRAVNPGKESHCVGTVPVNFESILNAEMNTRLGRNMSAQYVQVLSHKGLLVDFVKSHPVNALVRGIRNGSDLEGEKVQQYWNEDLGMKIPTVCFITDRKLVHISSTAVRELRKFGKDVIVG